MMGTVSLFGWLVADGWCWFVVREKYYWLVAGGWFVLREKYCWLVADKPSEQGDELGHHYSLLQPPSAAPGFRYQTGSVPRPVRTD
jgi:hypothetical protein